MATGDLGTLPELKDWIGVTVNDHDVKLANVITSVSRWIAQLTQREFAPVIEARVFDTGCGVEVRVDDISTITEVATDDNADGTFETVWSTSDYQPLPLNAAAGIEPRPHRSIRSTGTRFFPVAGCTGRVGLIRVTGTWGWPAIPEPVRQGWLIQSHRIFHRKDAPEGMLAFADFGVVRMQGRLDPDVAANLEPYRRTAVLVA